MEQQIVHLFVPDTLADWETGFAIAGINNPEMQKHPGRYAIRTVGLRDAPITTKGGVRILPDLTVSKMSPGAMLILPGADTWETDENAPILEVAKALLDDGIPIAAICGATAALARAGLLDARPHTSNALEYLQATGYRGAALYRNEPVVTGDNVITASSTAPLEFAYHVFRRLDLYEPPVLEAWFGLFKTGDASYFFRLQELMTR